MLDEQWLIMPTGRAIAMLAQHKLAIDVGANVGNWTAELAETFERVVAYEPDRRALDVIPKIENAEIVEAAVSDHDGEARLYLRPQAGNNSLLYDHPIGAGSQSPAPVESAVTVASVTLDSRHPDGADFVKIDVEGAEQDVLAGCSDVRRWARTVFVVECHDTRQAVAEELWRLRKRVELHRHPDPTAHPGHCWLIGRP
jgi:FkbM family methyltransferase